MASGRSSSTRVSPNAEAGSPFEGFAADPAIWRAGGAQEEAGYATAFATMVLHVPEARLSIYNRTPPKLPKP